VTRTDDGQAEVGPEAGLAAPHSAMAVDDGTTAVAPGASTMSTPPAPAARPASAPRTGWRRWAIDTRPLRHPAYRRMFIGNATSFCGAQFTAIAVPIQVYTMTRSNAWVGYVSAAGLVPLLVFALWGGALADLMDRRRLLLYSSLLMWAMTLGLLAQSIVDVNSPLLVMFLVAIQSGAVAVSMPTRSAIVPRIVDTDEVAQANTLNFTMSNVASVAGPLLAAIVIAQWSLDWAYAVDAFTFTVAMWAALQLPALPPAPRTTSEPRNSLGDVIFGLRYLATTPVLLLSFAVDIVAMVLAMPRVLFPAVAIDRFGGVGAAGWLYSAIAIGSVAAGITSGWVARVRRQGLALIGAVMVWGLAVAAAGLAGQLWLAVLLLGVGGAADLVSAVYRQTILLTYAPDELRGRMQGVFTAVVAGGPRLGDLRAGLTAAAFGGTTISWVGGGIAATIVVVVVGLAFPALRRYVAPTAAAHTP
jgi:MFS family permease